MSRASWVEETTTSIAGTSGDGAVTMTAITNKPRHSDVFGSGARLINYTIEKASNGYMEEGVGVVSSNVLTRTKPRATWNGSTFDDTNPSPLQFGSTPTLGDVLVRMAPVSHEFIPAPRGIQTTLGSDGYKGWQLSGHLSAQGNAGADNAVIGTGVERYYPYLSLTAGYVDGIALDINTAGSSGIKAALYEHGADGLPGPCITRFNVIANTSTGLRTDTTPGTWAGNAGPLRIGIDWYYIGLMADDATVRLSGFSPTTLGAVVAYPPIGRQGGYGFGSLITKSAENSYATGMPSGTPSGSYSFPLYRHVVLGLRIQP